MGKVYLPLRPYARLGDSVILRVQAIGLRARLLTGATDVTGDVPVFYGRVMTPVIFERELADGRLFRNLAEMPRFHLTERRRPGGWLAGVSPAGGGTPPGQPAGTPAFQSATVELRSYAEDEQVVDVSAPRDALLESSEKLTPELRVTIDGREVTPVTINTLFAGVPVPAGNHRVVFTRRIGRGLWLWTALALSAFVIASVVEARRR
jgi:hypothetical protein